MPYITQRRRDDLDVDGTPGDVGELTYALQRVIKEYIDARPTRFYVFAEVMAGIECVKADFVEQVLLPYEARKRAENGDVW